MEHALTLAEKGRFTVSPNPMVGCVIVKNHCIIGQGFHQRAGEPHAEIYALAEADEDARGADVYVTLEPCCHHGRTPPCTEALIRAGVKKVWIACQDPNPAVAGKGIAALHAAGIETYVGLKADAAKEINKIFFHYITHKRPFVMAKWAMSLDGKTITHPDDSRIISDVNCHTHAHIVRQSIDAILIGAETARRDNPQLTARYQNVPLEKQPLRIILTRQGDLSIDLAIFSPNLPGKTLIVVSTAKPHWFNTLKAHNPNIDMWVIFNDSNMILNLLKKLGEQHITSLLVEGGEQIRNAFFKAHCIDETQVYLSPVYIGDLEKKQLLPKLTCQMLGESLLITSSIDNIDTYP